MRTLRLLIRTTFVAFALLFLLECIQFVIVGKFNLNLSTNARTIAIFVLLFPVNALIHDRFVERVYLKEKVDIKSVELILKKYKAKSIRLSEGIYEYRLPLLYSWNRQVLIEFEHEKVRISAPVRVIRKIEKIIFWTTS